MFVMFANWLPADLLVDEDQELGWRSSPALVIAAIGMTAFTGKARFEHVGFEGVVINGSRCLSAHLCRACLAIYQ